MSDEPPPSQPLVERPVESSPGLGEARRAPPAWSYFLTPLAVVAGAFIVAGAILLTDDEPSENPAVVFADDGALTEAPTAGVSSPTSVLEAFLGYAAQVEIDADEFRTCLAGSESAQVVNDHLALGGDFGVSGTPTFFINNKKIVGSQPTEVFIEVIEAELGGSPTDVTQYSEAIQALAATSPPRFEIVDVGPDLAGAAVKGSDGAAVTIAEFSDFQCPFCQRWTLQSLPALQSLIGDDVKLAFLHFPITAIHPNAGYASVASICAGEQGKFWEMHDVLFARQAEWANLPVQ